MAPHMTPGKTIVYFIAFRLYFLLYLYYEVKLLSHIQLFAAPWAVAHQAPPSMEFSRKEHCKFSFKNMFLLPEVFTL